MQSVNILDGRTVGGTRWSPVVQSTRVGQTMCQPMGDAKSPTTLQLRQHDDHLPAKSNRISEREISKEDDLKVSSVFCYSPLQRRHRVHSFKLSTRGHHIVALLAITLHMYPFILMSILHHDDQASPALKEHSRNRELITT